MSTIHFKKLAKKTISRVRGFTLVEVLVSLVIFSIIIIMVIGAILSLVNAGEESRSVNSVMENLSVALETIAQTVRGSSTYVAYPTLADYPDTPQSSCGVASQALSVASPQYNVLTQNLGIANIVYGLDTNNSQIVEEEIGQNISTSTIPVTASEVHVTDLTFWVYNCAASSGSTGKPYILMSVQGYVETRPTNKVNFNIQTTMTQR